MNMINPDIPGDDLLPLPQFMPVNLHVRGLTKSATLAINEHSAALERAGRKVYRMGLGQSPFPVPESVVSSLRAHAREKDYLPVRGLPALREAVADYHRRVHGIDRDAEEVMIGPGSKELLFLLQLVYYGDLVVPSPSWVSYSPQAQIIGRQIRWVDTREEDGWRLQAGDLEALCLEDPNRPRVLILNYPNNPTGASYAADQLAELADVARRFRMLVVSDEIYGELQHRGPHVSIAQYYPEATLVSSGLSKWCGAGGWRLGTLSFPPELHWLLESMTVVASETFTTTSAPIQHAAVRAYRGGTDIDDYLVRARRILAALGAAVAERLRLAGCSLPEPEGGFYLFPNFEAHRARLSARGIRTPAQLCDRLLEETGVAALPGNVFGRPPGELTVRLSYVDFDGGAALAAASRDELMGPGFLASHCGAVLEGSEHLASWLNR
jgi:aspartate aminotransferase